MASLPAAIAEFARLLDQAMLDLPSAANPEAAVHGQWSKKQLLGHLIDSAANNHQRFVRGQLQNELATPSYEQNQWVALERFQDRDWADLVTLWVAYNKHLLHLMKHVRKDALGSAIRIGGGDPVTLEFVMIDYVAHMKHHLAQLGLKAAIE